jgi:type VI secretion system secreted protein Hcp
VAGSKFLLQLQGQKQGSIKGQPTKGRGDPRWLDILHCELITEPKPDPKKGKAHSPKTIVITREVDSTSPKLWQALNTDENILSAIIEQHDTSSNGLARLKWRITLTNAVIMSIRPHSRSGQVRFQTGSSRLEQLKLGYETIREERY